MGVNVSDTFQEFYIQYAGPFWEENVPFELLDIADEENNIESYTLISRKEHGFPKQYLVLSEMCILQAKSLEECNEKFRTLPAHISF